MSEVEALVGEAERFRLSFDDRSHSADVWRGAAARELVARLADALLAAYRDRERLAEENARLREALAVALHQADQGGLIVAVTADMDDLIARGEAAERETERLREALEGLLAHPTATAWSCSTRCWQEGGPHDETCHPIETEAERFARAALAASREDQP